MQKSLKRLKIIMFQLKIKETKTDNNKNSNMKLKASNNKTSWSKLILNKNHKNSCKQRRITIPNKNNSKRKNKKINQM